MNTAEAAPDWSDDAFFGGRLTLRQRRSGHRAGTDAVLLAASIAADAAGVAIDAGAASGAVGLMLALRAPALRVALVEIDSSECALARHNIAANALEDRCRVVEADLLASEAERVAAGLGKGDAGWIVSNPPFLDSAAARLSPDADRARAHALPPGGLDRWCRALAWLAAPDAQLALIHRADALPDILQALDGRFGALALRPVLPRADAAATRLLVTGRKGSRAKLSMLPPLVLHEADGRFTAAAAALHDGRI